MIVTKVDPKYLMGKAKSDGTFYRINQKSENPHHDKILRFGCGLYFVFKTESKSFNIKYKCHFSDNLQNHIRFTKKNFVECSVMGFDQKSNEWYYLNTLNAFGPLDGKSDGMFYTELKICQNYDKYQVCLPENGVSYDFIIESEKPIEFEYKKNEVILIGSSIAQFCNDCNQMNLCAYMYRTYGVNVATLGISNYHTFHNKKIIEFLKTQSDKKLIVVDLEHVHYDEYTYAKNNLNKLNFIVIDSIVTNTCKQLKKVNSEIKSFQPPGSWMYDARHLNDYGIVEYSKKIINVIKNK